MILSLIEFVHANPTLIIPIGGIIVAIVFSAMILAADWLEGKRQ